ncbi:hypothetical protein [Streptomyces sp. AM8-1-1]|uniref:hypothetical protein n=1 Tax=Streptomyces sp. AM8-1-1 TaxID=3075825 RepID=UPI0028C41986|nr:hypothetical protein [Streptomyces sp. AM8-1-1]WNO73767.1 hypothetical protein RPQ07_20040 [Streptomyces sp. AM8-1-1]
MSSDQQYPYDRQHGQQQPYPPQQQYPDPYQGQQPHDGRYDPSYDPSYDQSYAQEPYSRQSHPQQQGYPQQHQQQGYPQPSHPQAAQTWEGETWDTQYQPVLPPAQTPAAADTAYLPVQGAHPLPPETPAYAEPAAEPAAPDASAATGGSQGAGYSTPTVGGNTRITDAQRARAEGRSPIIPPGIQPAGLTAALGLLLAAGAAIGPYALLVPLVLLQAVTAAGWFRLNGMWPARQGIALAFAGGLAADVVVLSVGRENAPAAIVGTLGVWVLITLVLQLRSRASADERMQGLMATVASAALAILATGHLGAADDAVVIGGIAVAVATVARALPLPPVASVVLSLLAATGAGVAAGGATDIGTSGALLGLTAGVLALVGLRVASYDYPSRFVHFTAGVALPLTAAAPAVYLIGRVLA